MGDDRINEIENPDSEGTLEQMVRIRKNVNTGAIQLWFKFGEDVAEVALSKNAAIRFANTILQATK